MAYEAAVVKARRRKGAVVFTSDDDVYGAMALADFLDDDEIKTHRSEPCHAVLIEPTTYGQGYERTDICTDPERHAPDPTDADEDDPGTGSGASDPGDIGDGAGDDARPWPYRPAQPAAPTGPDLDSSHLKRKGRVARTAFTKEVFARPRGGISQTQATRMALRALICEAGMEALGFAADVLGVETAATASPPGSSTWPTPPPLSAASPGPSPWASPRAACTTTTTAPPAATTWRR